MPQSTAPLCPVCDAEVRLQGTTMLSELVVCDACSCMLEVRSLDPVQLAEAPQEQEDWGE